AEPFAQIRIAHYTQARKITGRCCLARSLSIGQLDLFRRASIKEIFTCGSSTIRSYPRVGQNRIEGYAHIYLLPIMEARESVDQNNSFDQLRMSQRRSHRQQPAEGFAQHGRFLKSSITHGQDHVFNQIQNRIAPFRAKFQRYNRMIALQILRLLIKHPARSLDSRNVNERRAAALFEIYRFHKSLESGVRSLESGVWSQRQKSILLLTSDSRL